MTMLFAAALILASTDAPSAGAPMPAEHAAMDHSHMDHAAVMASPAEQSMEPKESGQSAYAALGEAVAILLADPKTDWSMVDIDGLRRHLVDMDNVTLRARVSTTRLPNGARFAVSGDGDSIGSIERMTKSHFAMSDAKNGWSVDVQNVPDGAVVTATSSNPAESQKIAGLGYFGIMALGVHHQPHHLMMARGGMRH